MNILDVARLLNDYKKVKRPHWNGSIVKRPGLMGEWEIQWVKQKETEEDYQPWNPDTADLLADDWIEVA